MRTRIAQDGGGVGIDLGVWIDGRADPRVVRRGGDQLLVEIDLWLNRDEDPTASAVPAPYLGRIAFTGLFAYTVRAADGLIALQMLPIRAPDPPCLFELPLVGEPARLAHPYRAPGAPPLRRFVLVGFERALDVVAAGYEFTRAFPGG